MTTFIFANNVDTALAGGISSASTSITVSSTLNLPTSIPAGSYLALTFNDAATRTVYEIVYVTAISGATLTVIRGREGTSAQSWLTGDYVFSGPTAGQMANFQQLGSSGVTPGTYGSSTQVPQFTVNAQGQVTGVTNVAIAFPVTSFNGRSGAIVLNSGDVTSALGYTPVNKTGDTMTGALGINTSTSNGIALSLTNTGSLGAQIYMTGQGSTTPTKYLRVFNGVFQIVNNANSSVIFAVDDSGNVSSNGNMTSAASITASGNVIAGGGALQAGLSSGQYSTMSYAGVMATNRTINPASAAALLLNLSGSFGGGLHIQDGTNDWGIWDQSGTLYFGAGTSGGALTPVATLSPTGSMAITGSGTNGAQLFLNGNGSTTPNKMIRARSGNLEFVNSANSAIVTTMDDAGDWNMSGALTTGGGVTAGGNSTINGNLQVNGTISNTGTVNFYTSSSDEALKSGIRAVDPQPLHRAAPWMGYEWLSDGAYGEGPIAQQVQQAKPMYVREQEGQIVIDSKTGEPRNALGIAETRIALEVAYWAANGVDSLEARVAALENRHG